MNAAELPRLAEHIGFAARPAEWQPALSALVENLGAHHAVLVAHAKGAAEPIVATAVGIDDADFRRFMTPQSTAWMEPYRRVLPDGKAVLWSALMADDEFERTEFFNEIVRPMNGFYAVAARHESHSLASFVAVCRPRCDGDFEAADTRLLQLLLPHVATALDLTYQLRMLEQQTSGLGTVIDRLERGVVLSDADAKPLRLNAAAQRIVAEADGLTIDSTGLAAATPVATQRLRDAIAAASKTTGSIRIGLDRPSRRPRLLLSILPVGAAGLGATDAAGANVAILIKQLDGPVRIDASAVAELFQLTPRESEIAALVASGVHLDEIAERLGVGYNTVRSHLVHVFEKTGLRSQAELTSAVRGLVGF